MMYKV